MSHVDPFTIDGYEFRHTDEDPDLAEQASGRWHDLSAVATRTWRMQPWVRCVVDERSIPFAVFDQSDEFYGTWVLYRARPVDADPNVISALPGPMFQDIDSRVPNEAVAPTGDIYNADAIAEAEARSAIFWRRMFSIIEWQVMNPMSLAGGGNLVVDHFRFPQIEDSDPVQHCWRGVVPMFDAYSKLDIEWNQDMPEEMGPCPVRTLGWKTVDPDPGRARGSVNP